MSESRGWLSGSLSGSHLTERFGRNVQSNSLSHLLDWSLTMPGGCGLAHVEAEGVFWLSDGGFLSRWLLPLLPTDFALQREGQLVDQNLSSHP